MIVSYRDKETERFSSGLRVRAFESIERIGRLKLDKLKDAVTLADVAALPGNRFEILKATALGSSAFASTINGAYAFTGTRKRRASRRWKLSTITEKKEQTHFHPGEHIQEELDAMSMAPSNLAQKLGVPSEELQDVLACRKALSAEFALRLSHFFGTTAEFWMNMQISYELEKAEREHGAEIQVLPTLRAA